MHLCGECDGDCKRDELRQVRNTIARHSRNSGNPVIVVGDFNINGPVTTTETQGQLYRDIVRILGNPRDLWLEAHGAAGPDGPQGFTKDACESRAETPGELSGCTPTSRCACRNQRRIDYIFVVTDPALMNSRHTVRVRQPRDVGVVRWFLEESLVRVSDHFGVEATIELCDCR